MAFTVLSMDPGTTNYGVSIMRMAVKDDKLKVKMIGTQMLENPITEPKEAKAHARAFKANMYHLEHTYGPFDYVVAERFQARGLKGKTIESINMMLGLIVDIFPNAELYTAAVWKNAFNRAVPLRAMNKKGKEQLPLVTAYDKLKVISKPKAVIDRHQVHEFDCTLMGQYHVAQQFGIVPFTNLASEKRIDKFLEHFDASDKL